MQGRFHRRSIVAAAERLAVDRHVPLAGKHLRLTDVSSLDQPRVIAIGVVPFTFQLINGAKRPRTQVVHAAGGKQWLA